MPVKRGLLFVILVTTCFIAQAVNVLRGSHATIEAPAGVAFDKMLSAHAGMDVFRNESIILCMDRQVVPEGVNASSIAAALARKIMSDNPGLSAPELACRATLSDGRIVHVLFDTKAQRIYALTDTDAGVMSVIFVGPLSRPDALRYISSLRVLARC